jgi:hypothetical protein
LRFAICNPEGPAFVPQGLHLDRSFTANNPGEEAKVIPRGSADILAKVAGLSTESRALKVKNGLQFRSELVSS